MQLSDRGGLCSIYADLSAVDVHQIYQSKKTSRAIRVYGARRQREILKKVHWARGITLKPEILWQFLSNQQEFISLQIQLNQPSVNQVVCVALTYSPSGLRSILN